MSTDAKLFLSYKKQPPVFNNMAFDKTRHENAQLWTIQHVLNSKYPYKSHNRRCLCSLCFY